MSVNGVNYRKPTAVGWQSVTNRGVASWLHLSQSDVADLRVLLQGVVNPLTNRLDFSVKKVVNVSKLDTSVEVDIIGTVKLNQGLTGLSVNSELINRGGLAVSDGNEHCDCECKEYVAM